MNGAVVHEIQAQDKAHPHLQIGIQINQPLSYDKHSLFNSNSIWQTFVSQIPTTDIYTDPNIGTYQLGPLPVEPILLNETLDRGLNYGVRLTHATSGPWFISVQAHLSSINSSAVIEIPRTSLETGGTGGPSTIPSLQSKVEASLNNLSTRLGIEYLIFSNSLTMAIGTGVTHRYNGTFTPEFSTDDYLIQMKEISSSTGVSSDFTLGLYIDLSNEFLLNFHLGSSLPIKDEESFNAPPLWGNVGINFRICGTCGQESKMNPNHQTIPADQLIKHPNVDPDKRTIPADQLVKNPQPDPSRRTVPADQLNTASSKKPLFTGEPCEEEMPSIGNASLEGEIKQAKSKMTIHLQNGKAVWLEFEDGWREAQWKEYTDPKTGESKHVWFANLEDQPIKKEKIREQYSKSLVDCVSEISDSGLGMIFPGLDAWNTFNKGDYEGLAWEAGFELIPILGKAGKFIKVCKFGCNAKHADEVMECAVENTRQQQRISRSVDVKIRPDLPANGIAPQHARAFSKIASEKDYIIVVRNGNAESIKYHNRIDCMPKPVTVKAKTAQYGPDAGLVVNPNHPLQKKVWDRKIKDAKAAGLTDEVKELEKQFEKAQRSWKEFEDRFKKADVLDDGSEIYSGGFKIDERGRLLQNDKKIHGDYDLQGIYQTKDKNGNQIPIEKRNINIGSGGQQFERTEGGIGYATEGVAERNRRAEFNEMFGRESGDDCIMTPHGTEAVWKTDKTIDPGLPVTVFHPDGMTEAFDDIGEFYEFHVKNDLPWPKIYPKPEDFLKK